MKKLLGMVFAVVVLGALMFTACSGNDAPIGDEQPLTQDSANRVSQATPEPATPEPSTPEPSTPEPSETVDEPHVNDDSAAVQDSSWPVFEPTVFDPFDTHNFYFNLFGTTIHLHDRLGNFGDLPLNLAGNMGASLNMDENQLGQSSTGIYDRNILIGHSIIRGDSGPVTISNSVGTMFFTHDPDSPEPVSEATIVGIMFRYNEGGNYDWFSGPGGLGFGLTRDDVVLLIGEPTGNHTNLGREYSTWSRAEGIVLTLGFDDDDLLISIGWVNRNISELLQ